MKQQPVVFLGPHGVVPARGGARRGPERCRTVVSSGRALLKHSQLPVSSAVTSQAAVERKARQLMQE